MADLGLRSLFVFLSILLLAPSSLAASFPFVTPVVDTRSLVTVGGFVDTEQCYSALTTADADGDGKLDQMEYVTFCQELGPPGFLDEVTKYSELPMILQLNFNVLACLCINVDNDDTCCEGTNAHIQVAGASGEPTREEEAYLYVVCSLTSTSVTRVLESLVPSEIPSEIPSALPTFAPTQSPVEGPTESPVEGGTPAPTESPVEGGTPAPTESPVEGGTPAPTESPVEGGTPAPTETPIEGETPAPTGSGGGSFITVEVSYMIGVEGTDTTQEDYEPDLISAMNILAPDVLSEIRRMLSEHGRRLRSVLFDTGIGTISETDCPSEAVSLADSCATVDAEIVLQFQSDEQDPQGVADEFQTDLEEAIAEGELQASLNLVDSDSPVFIIDDTITPGDDDETGTSISAGGVAGIAVAVLAGVGLIFSLIRLAQKDEPKEDLEPLEPAPEDVDMELNAAPPKEEVMEKEVLPNLVPEPTLGATTPDYGKVQDAMVDNDEHELEDIGAMSHDSSSNAGSSGWSSSAGISSLNTGSHDGLSTEHDTQVAGVGASLAALSSQQPQSRPDEPPPTTTSAPPVSRADLDSAIEAGDWAAVGATAALLAAASDSQSMDSRSQSPTRSASGLHSATQSNAGSSVSSLDAARAAELDNLVDAGDWEGVVLAAAKYEAQGGGSSASPSASPSASTSADIPGSTSASISSTPSKAHKRQELRGIVEDLVRRVVPEEIENVDEMMLQFRGREEELVETLRTMQERAVAQKARESSQKAAKIEAKIKGREIRRAEAAAKEAGAVSPQKPSSTRSLGTGQLSSAPPPLAVASAPVSSRSLGTGTIEGPAKSKSLGTGTIEDDKSKGHSSNEDKSKSSGSKAMSTEGSKSKSGDSEPSQREIKQSALEEAIEKGDWEAVGEAAAMLSDHSSGGSEGSSADTEEINRLAEGISSTGSADTPGNLSEEAAQLDAMIEQGDWTGVVAAADNLTKTRDEETKRKKEEDEARKQRRLERLKEEQEALQQAEIWSAIAEQARQDDTPGDQAAREAADWAIGRSLQALVQAEQGGHLDPSTEASQSQSHTDDLTKKSEDDDEEEV